MKKTTVWNVWTNEEHHYHQSLLLERMMYFEHHNLKENKRIFLCSKLRINFYVLSALYFYMMNDYYNLVSIFENAVLIS